ncbi:MAG TPA: sensor histidine kinase [Candidatus Yonathbacteria bacterium]|nr:sensor histidine kinase [Candidatus Yonathbacteria bacterium]
MLDSLLTVTTAGVSTVIMGVLMLVSGWLVYKRDKDSVNGGAFLILAVVASLWAVSLGLFELVEWPLLENIFLKGVYIFSATLPIALLYYAVTLSSEHRALNKKITALVLIPYLFFLFFVVNSESIMSSSGVRINIGKEIIFGPNLIYFGMFIGIYFSLGFMALLKRYFESAGIFRIQVRYILLSAVASVLAVLIVNLVLTTQVSYDLYIISPLVMLMAIIFISYLTIKYNFWSPKLFATEIFIAFILIFLLSEIFFVNSKFDLAVKMIILILVGLSSAMLIRSVRNELESKEEVERLLKDLADTNNDLHTLDNRKSEFINVASHHLRDPLTAIKGYTSMLLEGSFGTLTASSAEAIGKIFESSKRLVVIVEDFMDISKIEAGRMKYEFTTVDLEKMTEEVVEELKQSVERTNLEINLNKDKKGSYKVKADMGKIRQVMSNLIDNAIKYTPRGSINVHLSRDDVKHSVVFCVEDTGIGMTPETKEKIFHKFSRAKDVSKQYTDGSGLGLYVAKEIVQKHNGRIWAESDGLGKGSRFMVELNIA